MRIKVLCQPLRMGWITKTLRVMKMTAFILLVAVFQVSAHSGYSQGITLHLKQATIKEVLRQISLQTGADYVITNQDVIGARRVDISVNNGSLEEVLDLCFKDQPVNYKMDGTIIKITPKPAASMQGAENSAPAPLADIHGRVTDSLGNPLQGAGVVVKGSKHGTSTDVNGNFSLKGVDPDATIAVTFVGYERQEIRLAGRNEIDLTLRVANNELSQVVVGYNTGYQRVSSATTPGSFAQVDNKTFNYRVSDNILDRLEGNVSGLVFNKNTLAGSNGGTDINIQGHSTLFSNDQPLVVVDNFPYDGPISNLNPNDIESVTVLKDAVAASIWGVRSGNGVIVVTTKRGRRGQRVQIDFNANTTIGEKPNLYYSPNYLPSTDYIDATQNLFAQGYFDSQLSTPYSLVSPVVDILLKQRSGALSSVDATAQINTLRGQDVRGDLSKYLYQKMIQQQYNVSFRGGGINNDYFASFGYDQDRQNYVGNTNNRVTINTGYNIYPTKTLQLSLGMNYVAANARNNSPIGAIGTTDPYIRLVDAKGNPQAIPHTYNQAYLDSLTGTGLLNWKYNPIQEIGLADNRTRETDNRINFAIKNSFMYGLSASVQYQYERSTAAANNYYSDSTYYARNLVNMYTQGSPGSYSYAVPIGGVLQSTDGTLTSHQVRGQLNFNHLWVQKHELSALVGAEVRSQISEAANTVAYGYDKATQTNVSTIDYQSYFSTFPVPYGSARIPNNSGYSKSTNNFISYFGNASYTYDGKYTASASGRIDHSNLFGVSTNQKAVPLYSVGLMWNIAREHFYKINWLSTLRLRSTFGYNANINTSATAVTTISQSTNSPFTGFPYASIYSPGNPELRWEKVRKINFGVDYGFINDRIFGTFDYYIKKGFDLFGSSPLSPSTGLQTFFGNTASTSGRGFDLDLNFITINSARFRWVTKVILSHAIDKVVNYDIKNTVDYYMMTGSSNGGTITPIIGSPLFAMYSYRWAGLTHDAGNPQGYVNGKASSDYSTILSTATFDSLQYNGSGRPLYFGSIRNNFSYKRFELSFNISYKFDYVFRRTSLSDLSGVGFGLGGGNLDYLKRWQMPGDEFRTNVPSMLNPPFNPDRQTFYRYSSILVDKADNVRLQDITVGYELSKKDWQKNPFTSLKLYAYINNLGILWKANNNHLDPDVYSGFANGIPAPRTYSVGVKATF